MRVVAPHSGKMQREIHTEIGKYKYDIQKVIVARDGSWLAYVNQENGKVLDLKIEPPKSLADLGDAYDLALAHDESELWMINREKIFGLKAGGEEQIGSATVLEKVPPEGKSRPALRSGARRRGGCIPSHDRLP